ncbi:zinc-binding dehydrogenase [Herbiconiux sp. YIM B11900]|uniref:zinc-binding dehydrogenase n=1 Tax=Herbiconiux sp. YIM B11900 TaxID=3404131 RepID=UPI003F8674A2
MTGPVRTRALVARGDGSPPEAIELELDALGARDVLVELEASAVCRTELLTIDRRRADPDAPAVPVDGRRRVLGHAATGRVGAVGAAVTRFAPGDAVVVTGTRQCGECFYCRNGTPGACDEIFAFAERRVGVAAGGEVVWSDGGIGTHAERMLYVESNLVRIAGRAPAEHRALLGCGIPSGAGTVRDVAVVRAGQSVGISGCGHVGLWMVQAAILTGASTVIAIDPHPWRREQARAAGATHTLAPSDDIVAQVRALTGGRGVDVGLEAAGTTLAMRQSFDLTRYGGTVVPTGLESERAEVRLDNLQYSLGSRRIVGSQCGGGDVRRSVPELEALLESGALRAEGIVTAVHTLDSAPEAYLALEDPTQLTAVIRLAASAVEPRPPAPAHPSPPLEGEKP